MAVASLDDIRDAAESAIGDATTAITAVYTALAAGTYTAADLGNLRASCAGVLAALRDVRSDLDEIDVATYQVHERGDRSLALWQWERGLRLALSKLEAQLVATDQLADTVALGIRRRVYIVRSGDTLQSIAAKLLGDWKEWPRLAAANALTPATLTAGAVLTVPDKR